MKKFMNSVDTVLTESLDGFVSAHADILVLGEERAQRLNAVPAVSRVHSVHWIRARFLWKARASRCEREEAGGPSGPP